MNANPVLSRVYFNKTADNSKDYLVDHSIIHYLIDPEGEFVTFYGEYICFDGLGMQLTMFCASSPWNVLPCSQELFR